MNVSKSGTRLEVSVESESETKRENGESGSESSKIKFRRRKTKSGTVMVEMYGTELKSGLKSVEPIPETKNFDAKKNLNAQKRIIKIEET